jgi:hypothetical protein
VDLGIDLEIVSSNIDSIEIEIPWLSLFSQNVKIIIDGLTITVSKVRPDKRRNKEFKMKEMANLKKEALKQSEANHLGKGNTKVRLCY